MATQEVLDRMTRDHERLDRIRLLPTQPLAPRWRRLAARVLWGGRRWEYLLAFAFGVAVSSAPVMLDSKLGFVVVIAGTVALLVAEAAFGRED